MYRVMFHEQGTGKQTGQPIEMDTYSGALDYAFSFNRASQDHTWNATVATVDDSCRN